MIELFGMGPTRWAKPYWMLKEIGVDFKEHVVDMMKGEHKKREFLAINPFGKVPALKDGDVVLFEATAILNYLGEKFPKSQLVPMSGTPQRAYYDQWTSYCVTELEQPLWRVAKHTFLYPETMRSPADIELAKSEFEKQMKTFDELIGEKKYLVGDKFTAVDITAGYTLDWAKRAELMAPHKNALRYLSQLSARPAFPSHLFVK